MDHHSVPSVDRVQRRQLPLAAYLSFVLFFLAGFADGALMPFFAIWAQHDAGIPVGYIGVLMACYAGGELLATPLLGGIADRIGRRPVIIISAAGVGMGFLALYFTHRVLASVIVLLAIGVFESSLHPTLSAVIVDSVPSASLRSNFAIARVASAAGHVAGPAMGALLALQSVSMVFAVAGASLLVGAILAAIWLEETHPHRKPAGEVHSLLDEDEEEGLAALLPVFGSARLAKLLLWAFAIEVAAGWMESVLPLSSTDSHMLTPSQVGLLFTYSAMLMVIFQIPVTHLLARVSARVQMVAVGALMAIAFVVFASSSALTALVVGVTILSIAQMLLGPIVAESIGQAAPQNARASYMAAASVVSDVRDTVGPSVGIFLYAVSPRLPWLAGIPLALGAAFALAQSLRGGAAKKRAADFGRE